MRLSIALFALGEVGSLVAIGAWSWKLGLLLFSLQCIGLGLLRESRADKGPAVRRPAPAHRPPRRRAADRLRNLRLIRGGVAS